MLGHEEEIVEVCRAAESDPRSAASRILSADSYELAEQMTRFVMAAGADPKVMADTLIDECPPSAQDRLTYLAGLMVAADSPPRGCVELGILLSDRCHVVDLPELIDWILIRATKADGRLRRRLIGLIGRLMIRCGQSGMEQLKLAIGERPSIVPEEEQEQVEAVTA